MHLCKAFFYVDSKNSEIEQYGLIAEEVDQVFPGIVVKDADGNPYTVQYQVLPMLLLNEMQKQHSVIDELQKKCELFDTFEQRIQVLERTL